MGKLFRSGRIRWAASIRLCAAAVPFALGAAGAQAQSVDVFGAAPAPSPAPAAPSPVPPSPAQSPAPRIPVAKDLITKSSIAWSPSPRSSPAPKGSEVPGTSAPPRKENAQADTLRPRMAQAAPRAASSQPAPIKPAPLQSEPPKATPASVATPAPPVAASARPAPIAAPPAAPPAPARSRVEEVLFPLGIGLGLAGELALLWLFLRWRARRAKRAKADAPPPRRPAPLAAEPPSAAPPPAEPPIDKPGDSENIAGDEDHAAIIARLFDQAQQTEPPTEPVAPHPRRSAPAPAFVAAFADEVDDADPPVVTPPALEIARRPAPEPIPAARHEPEAAPSTRGVFKPSPLFNRLTPAETVKQVPLAPPDPLLIGFEALRLSTSASHIELRFRVTLRNDGPAPLGPIRVDSCMSAPEGDLPDTALAHSLAMLMPGEEVAIAEEWRAPLAKLPVLRLGAMRLLVGAARIFTTVEGAAAHPFQDRTFMFGLPEDGGRMGPIPLDGGAHLYDNLLVQSVAPQHG